MYLSYSKRIWSKSNLVTILKHFKGMFLLLPSHLCVSDRMTMSSLCLPCKCKFSTNYIIFIFQLSFNNVFVTVFRQHFHLIWFDSSENGLCGHDILHQIRLLASSKIPPSHLCVRLCMFLFFLLCFFFPVMGAIIQARRFWIVVSHNLWKLYSFTVPL